MANVILLGSDSLLRYKNCQCYKAVKKIASKGSGIIFMIIIIYFYYFFIIIFFFIFLKK